MMKILGLNAYHGDAAACLVVDGKLVAAAEEERFNRKKHCAGFPKMAIGWCLKEGGLALGELDHIGVSRRPFANWRAKIFSRLRLLGNSPGRLLERVRSSARAQSFERDLAAAFPEQVSRLRARLHHVEHHLAHAASSFLVSPFDEAAILSVDGFGDYASLLMGHGKGNRMDVLRRVEFPHSLGLFYTAMTQWLGFPHYGDEGKVMALAAFAKPALMEQMRGILQSDPENLFRLNLDCFCHHTGGVEMSWNDGSPSVGRVFSPHLEELLGPARMSGEELTPHHYAVAASMQARLEEVMFEICRELHRLTGSPNLALSGGVALNGVVNGMISEKTPFRDLYIQPAAADSGTALGVAFYIQHQVLEEARSFHMADAFVGPEYGEEECAAALRAAGIEFRREEEIEKAAARLLEAGKIVGWFQGRMEFGPRALGNRSILAHPGLSDMKAAINARIKHREPFRPFAPSVLAEAAEEYFGPRLPSPFMLMVYPFLKEKLGRVPAVAHVDGTGRLQTVSRESNPRYHKLIEEFRRLTGIPMLLNTSFNDSEPIVCTPQDAIACYRHSHMDVLVLGNLITKG
ncbi:MAG: carbamoyltransferase C-terminal domain-containing protein [Verrucomicrobiae bacterium]|nr:carbamoyltransferase C-terminal domain-containing protein [Verrucomicrobiae bacterium]